MEKLLVLLHIKKYLSSILRFFSVSSLYTTITASAFGLAGPGIIFFLFPAASTLHFTMIVRLAPAGLPWLFLDDIRGEKSFSL